METSEQANPFPEERRLATVLLAEVQGCTVLPEQHYCEMVSEMIKDRWSRLDPMIGDGGGCIDKHMGNGVMAAWVAPSVGERDAENAVEVALGLRTSLEMRLAVRRRASAEAVSIQLRGRPAFGKRKRVPV